MFFVISKILGYFLNPLSWIIILLLLAVIFKRAHLRRNYLVLAFILLLIFTNPFIGDEFLRTWEVPLTTANDQGTKYAAGVLLTGDIATYDHATQRVIGRSGSDRLMQIIELYQQGVIEKIIVSGGSGHLIYTDRTEAVYIGIYLSRIGIPEEAVIMDTLSKNTHQNTLHVAEILQQYNITEPVLLITSALHMKRAGACFERAGIPFIAYPTAKITGDRLYNFDHLFIPSVMTLKQWDLLIHELVGYVAYKVMGYC